MADALPPVIVTLIMDNAEFEASAAESKATMAELGAASETTAAKVDASGATIGATGTKAGSLVTSGIKKLSTAVIGAGVAFVAFGVDRAIKLQDAYDNLQNTTNVTASELDHIKTATISLSDATGQSAVNIVGAWQVVEAAGYKNKAAQDAVTAATKLTVIAGGDLVTNIKSLVAAQELGITKGLSAAKVADLFLTATKGNVNGIGSVVNLLQGKVGAAFSAYKQGAGEAVTVANALSEVGYTNTRVLGTFIKSVGEAHSKLVDYSVSNGKVTASTSTWVNGLLTAGLNIDKVRNSLAGPDGLVNGLKYLQTVAHGSLGTLNNDLTAVFGANGPALGQLILKYTNAHPNALNAANAASGAKLNKSFNTAINQLGNQWKRFWANVTNDAAQFGLDLLPGIKDALGWLSGRLKSLSEEPLSVKILAGDLGVVVAAAIGLKLALFVKNIQAALQQTTQTGLLAQIARNTALTATATESTEGEVATEAGIVALPEAIATAIAAGLAVYIGKKYLLPVPGAVNNAANVVQNSTEPTPRNGPGTAGHRGLVWEPIGGPTSGYGVWVTPAALKQFELGITGPGGKPKHKTTVNVKIPVGFHK